MASHVTSPVSYDVIKQREQGFCRNYVLNYLPRMCDDCEVRLSGVLTYELASPLFIRMWVGYTLLLSGKYGCFVEML